jgi:hypothetical protein
LTRSLRCHNILKSSIIDHPPRGNGDQEQTHHKPTIEDYIQLATMDMEQLPRGQQPIFNTINAAIDNRTKPQLYFIDGPGGAGKTFLYSTPIEHKCGQHKPVVVVVSSEIVSIALYQGQTVHSAFNIPISITNKATCFFTRRSILGEAIINAAVVFWDGSSMLHKNVYEAMVKPDR